MRKIIRYLHLLLLVSGIPTVIHAQSLSDSLENTIKARLDDEIARFDDTMDFVSSLDIFRSEFGINPSNPFAALYLARAFDKIASIGNTRQLTDSVFLMYTDSALKYYRLADKIQPGIKERKFGFTVPVMIGHVFGTLCLWHIKHGEYAKGQQAMIDGKNAGGFMDAQIEVCRLMLDFCDTNAIFFPMGDDDTFPTMYLQMVEGYRTDVSVINSSLANMSWYAKLFLQKGHKGFTPVKVTMTTEQLDSIDNISSSSVSTIPDRLYTDVDVRARDRIHKELGIDVSDKAEICFPVYQDIGSAHYTLGFDKFIASILQTNQWKRRIFFGIGLENYLHCTNVAIRDGAIIQELYPINLGQAGHFKKNDRWFHSDRMKKIFLHDAKMVKFSSDQPCSVGRVMMYYGLTAYLSSLDDTDKSVRQVILNIQSIPHGCLTGSEETVLTCARFMYKDGFKEEAKRECMGLLPVFKKKSSISRTNIDENDIQYIIALLISNRCSDAKEFINSFDLTPEAKAEYLQQIRVGFSCD